MQKNPRFFEEILSKSKKNSIVNIGSDKMSLLKCLKDFVPSESNLYSEEEMRDINIRVLEERGVTVDDIAQLADRIIKIEDGKLRENNDE